VSCARSPQPSGKRGQNRIRFGQAYGSGVWREAQGVEPTITSFKDSQGRVKRQAARFRVFAYDEADSEGVELKVGDILSFVEQKTGRLITAKILDVTWTVYLAN